MLWDIFCKVIDNFGDIGVSWRLSADLASRGEQVRLWVDDASALQWMAPAGCQGVTVHHWTTPLNLSGLDAGDRLIEAFGCEPDPGYVALFACRLRQTPALCATPYWINLEYLTAEPFAQRSHGLPSPIMHGPGAGLTKHFFFPGFGAQTGGLLREADWVAPKAETGRKHERLISLFCYEPLSLNGLLNQLAQPGPDGTPNRLLVTAGRASLAVSRLVEHQNRHHADWNSHATLTLTYIPAMSQRQFDELLGACDLNFVRGEDSLVRALWAGKPFVWQIYPQADNAHHAKLEAFLDALQAPAQVRLFHQIWNGTANNPLPDLDTTTWQAWQLWAAKTSALLRQQSSLVDRLLEFMAKTR